MDLDSLPRDLEAAAGPDEVRGKLHFLFRDSEEVFTANFLASAKALAGLLRDLVPWVREQLRHHDHVAILGI
jgi:hypothetical protein